MGTRQIKTLDVDHGGTQSNLRLLAPLRYLKIRHPEKRKYDVIIPALVGVVVWGVYEFIQPRPALFGDAGLLRFARDLLIMAVPFMVGALAAVSMGAPGPNLDRRPIGAELWLDNDPLTMRQFLCFLLGYLSFLGLGILIAVVAAGLLKDGVLVWTSTAPHARAIIHAAGAFGLSLALSFLSITVLWSLYFLTDVANRKGA
jgi:glycine/D-amino acid oxidase-like deaminating enzyme